MRYARADILISVKVGKRERVLRPDMRSSTLR